MKAYQDKTSGMWKWGRRGEYVFSNRDEAYRHGMNELTATLRRLKERQVAIGQGHGRKL